MKDKIHKEPAVSVNSETITDVRYDIALRKFFEEYKRDTQTLDQRATILLSFASIVTLIVVSNYESLFSNIPICWLIFLLLGLVFIVGISLWSLKRSYRDAPDLKIILSHEKYTSYSAQEFKKEMGETFAEAYLENRGLLGHKFRVLNYGLFASVCCLLLLMAVILLNLLA